jgi:hypothetical protein
VVFPAVLHHWNKANTRVFRCARMREREKLGNVVSQQRPLKLHPSPSRYAVMVTARRCVACVTCGIGTGGLHRKTRLRSCRKLAALPNRNDTTLKDFICCKPVCILMEQVLEAAGL